MRMFHFLIQIKKLNFDKKISPKKGRYQTIDGSLIETVILIPQYNKIYTEIMDCIGVDTC